MSVTATSSRLAKVRELADCLRRLQPDEVPIAIAFLSGEVRQGKLAVGSRLLRDTCAPAGVASLSLAEVDAVFAALKSTKGKGTEAKRAQLLGGLFGRASVDEQDFLARLIVGELRQGALEGVMLEAVAAASGLPAADVRRAATFAGGVAPVAQAALAEGAAGLLRYAIVPMQPVLPMLAQPAQDARTALGALGQALLEWKLDGARVQVHKRDSEVRVFTRSLNDVTPAVPEVVAA